MTNRTNDGLLTAWPTSNPVATPRAAGQRRFAGYLALKRSGRSLTCADGVGRPSDQAIHRWLTLVSVYEVRTSCGPFADCP